MHIFDKSDILQRAGGADEELRDAVESHMTEQVIMQKDICFSIMAIVGNQVPCCTAECLLDPWPLLNADLLGVT